MTEIKTDNYVFLTNIEKTREYYKNRTICECDYCRYFHSNIIGKFPKFEAFLSQFGVDITKPDETSPLENDGEYEYLLVGYTVCGKVLSLSDYEIDIDDNLPISICVDEGFAFPNAQNGEYFSLSVFGISLPCETARGIEAESLQAKIKRIFRKYN